MPGDGEVIDAAGHGAPASIPPLAPLAPGDRLPVTSASTGRMVMADRPLVEFCPIE
jgi:hypothetical protein